MQSRSHCNIAMNPQLRKLNHTIITNTISAARKQMANFLPVCADDNRDFTGELCNSTRDFTDRWMSFIRCYRGSTSDQ
jgi:hypothetical protein